MTGPRSSGTTPPDTSDAARALEQRDFEGAEVLARAVLAQHPDSSEAWTVLASSLEGRGQADAAEQVYADGIARTHAPPLHNNLAFLLARRGDRDGARRHLLEAVARDPNYSQAWSNLAALHAAEGNNADAEKAFRSAIDADPRAPLPRLDFARLYLAMGQVRLAENLVDQADAIITQSGKTPGAQYLSARQELALGLGIAHGSSGNRIDELGHLQQAIELGGGQPARERFMRALDGIAFQAPRPSLKVILLRALEEHWGFASQAGRAAARLLLTEIPYRELRERVERGNLEAGAELLPAFGADRLFLRVLEQSLVTEVELERIATALRSLLLRQAISGTGASEQLLALSAAISCQCFANGYTWAVSTEEQSALARLTLDTLETVDRAPIPTLTFGVLASYAPLTDFAHADRLLSVQSPVAPLALIIERQIRAPIAERELRAAIKATNPVSPVVPIDPPYPFWIEAPLHASKAAPAEWLRKEFPSATIRHVTREHPNLLVARCRTGEEVVGLSLALQGAAITACDTSLANLGYAMRKTRELGISNVVYVQADASDLHGTVGLFDIVVASAGTLEGPGESTQRLRSLSEQMQPGGYIVLELFSERGRRDVSEARAFARERRYDRSPGSLRTFRQDVLGGVRTDSWQARFASRRGFHELLMLRDLLFAEERTFDPKRIGVLLEGAGLQFLGFHVSSETERLFRLKFGSKANLVSLSQWEEFEADYPNIFEGGYRLLCQNAD